MVSESHEDARRPVDDEDDAHRGLCDPYTATIFLRDDQNSEDMLHSFFHELGHALLFATGAFQAKFHNETLVDQFGALMAQFWTTCKGDHVI